MGPAGAEIDIDVSREEAFAAISDLARRPSFTDHFLRDFRLTRIESDGVGAGARFRVENPFRKVWMDTTVEEVHFPHKLVERGRGGRANRIPQTTVWEVLEAPGGLARVKVSQWTEPSNPVDKALESLSGSARSAERGWREAMRRLRDQLEADGVRRPRPIEVAGGNRYATGIP
jgi:uncharacterized protein YndB with AHSA1/START domain